jgi:ATP phosphoribosyltransferase
MMRLSLVLPDGPPGTAALELFGSAGLAVRRRPDQDHLASVADPRIARLRFLPAREIPPCLERGLFDLGIVRRDWIAESDCDVVDLGEFRCDKAAFRPFPVVLAVPSDAPWHSPADLPDGIRIATKYPSLTGRFLGSIGIKGVIVPSADRAWSRIPDIADATVDAIADVADRGTPGPLRVLATLLTAGTGLAASRWAHDDAAKRAAMRDIALLLLGAAAALDRALLRLRVSGARLAAVARLLPTAHSATGVRATAHEYLVEAVAPARDINVLIPELKRAGAHDIMEIRIEGAW